MIEVRDEQRIVQRKTVKFEGDDAEVYRLARLDSLEECLDLVARRQCAIFISGYDVGVLLELVNREKHNTITMLGLKVEAKKYDPRSPYTSQQDASPEK